MLLDSDELNWDHVHGLTIKKLNIDFSVHSINTTLVKTHTTETYTCTAIEQTMIRPMILGFVVCTKRINVFTKLQITKEKLKGTPDCY